uniref:YDG domain-containing protein n=1 Tax=Mycena chlorophos TaxID=658473 RepID=A0ABQ0LFP4_MYCCL|nr:predicted protein [Mycena chlorophos]
MCSLRPDPQVHNDIRGIPIGTLFADRADVYKSGILPSKHPPGRANTVQKGSTATRRPASLAPKSTAAPSPSSSTARTRTTKTRATGLSSQAKASMFSAYDIRSQLIASAGRGKASLRQREREGGIELKPKNKNSQLSDQNPNSRGNRALRESLRTHHPIRVIRGPEGNPAYCPVQGYRYDGLYEVVDYKFAPGIEGYKMCFFTLQRCTSFTQAPLPLHITGDKAGSLFWSLDRDSAGETLNTPIPVRSLSQRKDSVYVSSEDRYRAIAGKKRIPDTKIPKRGS